jgi:hypothetical protein
MFVQFKRSRGHLCFSVVLILRFSFYLLHHSLIPIDSASDALKNCLHIHAEKPLPSLLEEKMPKPGVMYIVQFCTCTKLYQPLHHGWKFKKLATARGRYGWYFRKLIATGSLFLGIDSSGGIDSAME